MRKIIIVASFCVAMLFGSTTGVQAAILDKQIDRLYEVREGYVQVTETARSNLTNSRFLVPAGSEEVFTIFNPILNDDDFQTKIDSSLPTIQVTDSTGRNLSFTTQVEGQNLLIKVPRPQNITFGQPYTISATYRSYALSSRSGALIDIYIPSFSKDFQFSDDNTNRTYNTKILIPKSFGDANLIVPSSSKIDAGDNWQIEFSQEQLTDTISWIQIGTKQYYDFAISLPVSPTTTIPLFYNTYEIALPRDVDAGPLTQRVFFTNISPKPHSVTQDIDGNLIASFRIPANLTTQIEISGYATVQIDRGFKLSNGGNLADIPTEYLNITQAAPFWEVDSPQISALAAELKGSDTDIYTLVKRTYDYVVDKIDYSEVKRFGINERQGALKTLQGGAAVCMEYSDLFIALMRAQGIPARAAFGYGYDARSTNGEQTAHQWAEVYMPALDTWIGVDTTWGESGNSIIGGDLNHFYKFMASRDPQTPAPISLAYFGSPPTLSEEQFSVEAIAGLPTNTPSTTPSQLLQDYPVTQGLQAKISEVADSVMLAIATINSELSSLLDTQFGVGPEVNLILRVLIFSSPIIILVVIVLVIRKLINSKNGQAKQQTSI